MNKNTKITIITLIVLIVLVGITLLILHWRSNKNNTTTTNTTSTNSSHLQTVTSVTFTSNKFSPSQITVDAGTTIEFMNNSDNNLWITSSSTGFDSGKTISKSASYAHTFTTKGTFKYQNKLDSSETGQVTVL